MRKLPPHEVGSGNVFAAKAAEVTGMKPSKRADLLHRRFEAVSIERLMRMLTIVGRDIEIVARPAPRPRGPENLRFTRAVA